MLMRSGWIFLFLCFWAWRLAAEPNISFPKDTRLSAQAQTEIVSSLVKSCSIATDFASLNVVGEVRRQYEGFDLYLLSLNVQFNDSPKTDEISLRVRDFTKSGGSVEIFDVHSSSGQCFYRGIFISDVYNSGGIAYEPWMQDLQSLKAVWNVEELDLKVRFTAYDANNFLRTEKRIAELTWRELFGATGIEPFPCGVVHNGEYRSGKTEKGYLVEGQGDSIVDTCYNQELGKTWSYSVRVILNEDNKSGVLFLKSSRKPQDELLSLP